MKLIDRDAITNKDICEYLGRDYTSCAPDIEDLLDEQPTVEAESVRHGRWLKRTFQSIIGTDVNSISTYIGIVCSECGKAGVTIEPLTGETRYNFCPYCGAKMDEKEN